MPIQVCVRFSRAFRLLGARYGVGAGVATLGQGAERGRVPGTLRDRGGLPRGAAWDALARGPDLPGLRRPGLLPAQDPQGAPVPPLQEADLPHPPGGGGVATPNTPTPPAP